MRVRPARTYHRPMERTPPLILLLSAPSGGGKTTVMQGMLAAQARLRRVVTCTTRPPRAGERDGVDYHFFTREEFDRRVAAGDRKSTRLNSSH